MLKRIALTTLAAAATFTTAAVGAAAVTPAAAQSFGIYIGTPMPAPRYYYAPPVQRVWVPGGWRWYQGRQVWFDGRWEHHGPAYYRSGPGWNQGWGRGHD